MAAHRKRTATAVNLDSRQGTGPVEDSPSTRAKRPRQSAFYPQHLVLQGFTPLGNTNAAALQQLPPSPFTTSAPFITSAPSLDALPLMLAPPPPPPPPPHPLLLNGPLQSLMLAAPAASGLLPNSAAVGHSTAPQPDGLAQSQQRLLAMTHAVRVDIVQQQQETTKTGATYGRHVNNYTQYWSTAQDAYRAEDPSWTPVPAFPITATKAALFIRFETQRPKLIKSKNKLQPGAEYQQGTTVGVESIKQAISALEAYRRDHAWEYPPGHETQIKLRDDLRIRTIEEDAAKNESQRVDNAQKLKAAGTSTDTYTVEDLIKLSKNGLCEATTAHQLVVDVRDRAMLLLSSQMAFRGDNLRQVTWSDLFSTRKPNLKAGLNSYFEVMGILADQGKTNKHSRVDEIGALRHKQPELCAVGALAIHFFVLLHPELGNESLPSFTPDFSDAAQAEGFGQYGKRAWYLLHVFRPDGQSCVKPMTYNNHYKRVKKMHEVAGVSISKATHAGRTNAAQTAREHGATVNDTKALGLWNESGSYRNCYDRLLPLGAMLGAAHHLADRPEAFFIARDALDPPKELLVRVFPWIEGEEAALEARRKANTACDDIALKQFLGTLKWFRRVLIQDVAVFYSMEPRWPSVLYNYSPFNLPLFDNFARGVARRIVDVEHTARLRLDELPERVASTFSAAMQKVGLQQRAEQEANRQLMQGIQQQIVGLAAVISDLKSHEPRAPSQSTTATHSSQLAGYQAMLASYQGQLTSMSLDRVPPAQHPMGHWPNARIDSIPQQLPVQPVPQPAPLAVTALPVLPLDNLPPPVDTSISPVGPHGTLLHAPSCASSPTAAVAQTLLACASPASVAPTPSASPPLAPLSSPQPSLFPMTPSTLQIPFQQPHLSPAFPAATPVLPMPIFAPREGDHAALIVSWQDICTRYASQIAQVEAHRVAGEWRPSKDSRTWVPTYKFSSSTALFDLWKEWTEGCNGKFSVEALDTGWSASWRAEASVRTAYCRRSRVIGLLRKLSAQRAWNIQLAIRFLQSKGPGYQKHTSLYDILKGSGTESKLMADAHSHKF